MSSSDSSTRLAGLIGFPLGHSVSPPMQQAAFDHHNLPWRYSSWQTAAEDLPARVASLREARVVGANVTVPHKQAVMPLLDEVDTQATFVGAVNTIINRDGRLSGYNTDVPGFLQALRADAGFDPRGAAALLLGAGGAARAAAYALIRAGAKSLTIANRHDQRAAHLRAALDRLGAETQLLAVNWNDEDLAEAAGKCDLLVNTTTVGMRGGPAEGESPLNARVLHRDLLVFDLVYNPQDTPLARAARAAGATAITGLSMLVYQGAHSFTLWTGLPAPVEPMRAAAEAALEGAR